MAVWSRVLFALSVVLSSQALRLPSDLLRRSVADYTGQIIYTNANQTEFFVDVLIDGVAVSVLLDTTEADLWVTGSISQSSWQKTSAADLLVDFGFSASISGPVFETDVTIAGVDVSSQAFLYTSGAPADALSIAGSSTFGLMGLGPTAWSAEHGVLGSAVYSPIDAALLEKVQEGQKPYVTLLISPDPSDLGTPSFAGFLTISETVDLSGIFDIPQSALDGLPDFSAVLAQPVVSLGSKNDFAVSAIAVAGASVSLQSGPLSATVASAESYNLVPKYIADAIYGQVRGAWWSASDSVYYLPCDAQISVSITIGGVPYTMDPADVVGYPASSGQCVGLFKVGNSSSVGIVLGVPFLQNVYTVYGYSSWGNGVLSQPYYQFLPLTDSGDSSYGSGDSHARPTSTFFVTVTHTPTTTVAVGGPTSGSSSGATRAPSPSSSSSSASRPVGDLAGLAAEGPSTSSNSSPSGSLSDQLKHCLPAIIFASVLIGVILVASLVWYVASRRRQRWFAQPSAYRTLHTMEVREPVHVPLYGAEEERGHVSYSDPYQDHEKS
ncbi:aspartic peptidase domain-containing protein [Amylocystis lapponica]|nr:aspartic peptidase domain-containing protein [Amylocystis lapponica]